MKPERARRRLWREIVKNRSFYFLAIFGIAYFIVFKYVPMYGIIIAFKNFSPRRGILGSPWVGLEHFVRLFHSLDFFAILRNTLVINLYRILVSTPVIVAFALMLNELRNLRFKKVIQTISYFPHFLSWVVVSGLVFQLFAPQSGSVNRLIVSWGGQPLKFLMNPRAFRSLIVLSGLWKEVGWGSIIYLAAISAISPTLYEAAIMDGAGRWKQTLHITLPGIFPTIVILLLIRIGHIMSVGFEQIFVFLNPMMFEVGDVFSTYIYRVGLGQGRFSYTTAVGLFNTAIGFLLLLGANALSRKLTEEGLW